jgi:molybdenum cofactor biosynthesis protein MoaC
MAESNDVPTPKLLPTQGASLGQARRAHTPWGLSRENPDTIDTFVDPNSRLQQEAGRDSSPQSGSKGQSPKTSSQVIASEKSPQSQVLTHVDSSGEAHMVDVGGKAATKRTAIASACVTFSNAEPFRLISENANKKGDVLGVARIAGIMGAKRTSDLIPLCHPINISKINVDVKLLAPHSPSPLIAFVNHHIDKNGAVEIEALVECVGATGVEMEALTAATLAATTVVDMCKAVDRKICIVGSRVVYKSGGKSGTHCLMRWARQRGTEFFTARGLEVPPLEQTAASNKSKS